MATVIGTPTITEIARAFFRCVRDRQGLGGV